MPCVLLSALAESGSMHLTYGFLSVIIHQIYFNEEWCLNKCHLCKAFLVLRAFWGIFWTLLYLFLFHWHPDRTTVGESCRVHSPDSGLCADYDTQALPAEVAQLCENEKPANGRQAAAQPHFVSVCFLCVETFMSVLTVCCCWSKQMLGI